ncbi:hypothetical protein CCZ20_24535 [Priestia aryabhattai]|uniref:hypothetical protein n=1 Tax=Priestia aryabhattai TaxID=412384 RepID=UPI000B4FE0BF|nr:hypothetical protein [Priestia aryabhattai]OVE34822.1 hypothetical protein CCZ20_24535 [Priestia aryabhattai]
MLKEAFEYIVGLGNKKVVIENGQKYATGSMQLLAKPVTDSMRVRSLSGLVEYIQSEFDSEQRLMVHVKSPTEVICFDSLNENANRNNYIEAKAMLPEFSFDRFMGHEKFNIKLQSAFVKNDDRDIMLQVVGNIREENVNSVGDDGVSQSVTAKTGVATVGQVKVPNPVALMPYRTFTEVDQPESNFVFRMQSGPDCALFEADGGAWQLEAMKNIKEFLEFKLEKEIEHGKVVVIA